ncbi:glycosyltransferase family 4 protein [Candidatus Bathyarchaeota archaeon]|nr:MAG: glycosyltransferase family 4 protein [Candidatus Bathyarchaeota archaeon]
MANLKVLVVHPRFDVFGGGEYLAINVMQALDELGHDVYLRSLDYNEEAVERAFGSKPNLAGILPLADFKPKFRKALALQKAISAKRQRGKVAITYSQFDQVWHTQTTYWIESSPGAKLFNIFYDPTDIFTIGSIASKHSAGESVVRTRLSTFKKPYYYFIKSILHTDRELKNTLSIPLSRSLEVTLNKLHYPHTGSVPAPASLKIKPGPKRKQVVLVTRIAPQKRIGDFFAIARMLPQYRFILLGSVSATERRLMPGYADNLIRVKPSNVDYVEKRLWTVPEILEESAVYLYPAIEEAINIAFMQGCGAGCIPVAPSMGGGAELIDKLEAGYTYSDLIEAARSVTEAIENPKWTALEIQRRAEAFDEAHFRNRIKAISKGEYSFP